MDGRKILIVSQVMPQWYIDLIISALPDNTKIDCITGSDVDKVSKIDAPKYVTNSFKTKFISWIKYCLFVLKWANKNKKNQYDLIFAVSNPPLNAFIGVKLKKIFKAPFVFMNWDIYPQSIEVVFKNPIIRFACKVWHKLNNIYYPKIDRLITIGEIMAESINKGLKRAVNITVLPIAADTDTIRPVKQQENPFIISNNLEGKFVVLYSGNMGCGHNIKIILDAAESLASNGKIQFVLIGEGQQYNSIKEHIKAHKLCNVHLFPWQPADIFPYSVACGDIAVVTEETNQSHLFMPSRTYSMMAAEEAIIGVCSEHDDLNLLISKYDIGSCVTDNSPETLRKLIEFYFENENELKAKQLRARKVAEEIYSIPVIAQGYKDIFDELIGNIDK